MRVSRSFSQPVLSFLLPHRLLSSPLRPFSFHRRIYIYVYRPEAAHPRAQSVHRTVDRETFDLTAKPDRQKAFFCELEKDSVSEREKEGEKEERREGRQLEAGLKDLTDDLRPQRG